MIYTKLSNQDAAQGLAMLKVLAVEQPFKKRRYFQLLKQFPKADGSFFTKNQLVSVYRGLTEKKRADLGSDLLDRIKMKPMRTMSGVAPVTVLTKPFPCPGKCIFCPNDIRMPKSYLADEPGAQRAERNYFDPYLQTYNRLQALQNIGHDVDKVEIIVLGGTWSYYPEAYQIWFIEECFRALNDFGKRDERSQVLIRYDEMRAALKKNKTISMSNDPMENKKAFQQHQINGVKIDKTYNHTVSELYVAPEITGGFHLYQQAEWSELKAQQDLNESANVRCVGLVIETRPDNISKAEVLRIRRLGCTKTQIGLQSLQDSVLEKNKRGHDVASSRRAIKLLRQAGFKIHAHWMANLYGSSVEADKKDYQLLFSDPDFRPDELKVYPCSLIGTAELMQYHKEGKWQTYTYEELLSVLEHAFEVTPEYCRLTRVIRDIPSTDIVEGNKLTNFRQIAEQSLAKKGFTSRDIRAREVRDLVVNPGQVSLRCYDYQTSSSTEKFLEFVTEDDKLVAFLRLSLPTEPGFVTELENTAIIREVHVYGKLAQLGKSALGKSQHAGFGTRLLQEAEVLSRAAGFDSLAVISAIGTREYYRKRGFEDGDLYQKKVL
ncbi:MAG: tRNA uridine(34) 5-carboxymethylaminomethyl modification radical SAM/GNAT enzyme Elp3 [Patescibacteria group bacterium]